MTTGFFRGDWLQGGAVPGRFTTAAGGRIAVLDYVFTSGPSPWTKTVDGTNIVSYQAPGGSQIKLTFYDNQTSTVSYISEVVATVGLDVFPTPTQQTTLNRVGFRHSFGTANTLGWYFVRTDRLIVMATIQPTSSITNQYGGSLVAGDLPVYSPSDPGLCVLLGVAYGTTQNSTTNAVGVLSSSINYGQRGYAHVNRLNNTKSVPAGVINYSDSAQFASGVNVAAYDGEFPLLRLEVFTNATQAASTTAAVLRGWIPYVRYAPFNTDSTILTASCSTSGTGTISGYPDILTADGIDYYAHAHYNAGGSQCFMMIEDGEDLP